MKYQIFHSLFNGIQPVEITVETFEEADYANALDRLIAWNQKDDIIYMLRKVRQ